MLDAGTGAEVEVKVEVKVTTRVKTLCGITATNQEWNEQPQFFLHL